MTPTLEQLDAMTIGQLAQAAMRRLNERNKAMTPEDQAQQDLEDTQFSAGLRLSGVLDQIIDATTETCDKRRPAMERESVLRIIACVAIRFGAELQQQIDKRVAASQPGQSQAVILKRPPARSEREVLYQQTIDGLRREIARLEAERES